MTYAACGAAGLGLVLLVMWHQVGHPFAWLQVQDDWGRNVSWPWTSVIQGFQNLYPRPRTVMVPALVARNLDLWCVPIVLVGVGYLAFSRKPRFPMEAWMLGVAMIVMGFSLECAGQLQPVRVGGLGDLSRLRRTRWAPTEVAALSRPGRGRGCRDLDDVPDDRTLLGEPLRGLGVG